MTIGCSFIYFVLYTGHNYWRNRVVEVGEGVDYQQCGSLGDSNTATMVHVVCPGPLKGRYVQIKASSGANGARLFLCEVYVNGYRYVGMHFSWPSPSRLPILTEKWLTISTNKYTWCISLTGAVVIYWIYFPSTVMLGQYETIFLKGCVWSHNRLLVDISWNTHWSELFSTLSFIMILRLFWSYAINGSVIMHAHIGPFFINWAETNYGSF